MKKSLSFKVYTVLYLLISALLIGYTLYDIFRLKTNTSPIDILPLALFLALSVGYNTYVRKTSKAAALKDNENK